MSFVAPLQQCGSTQHRLAPMGGAAMHALNSLTAHMLETLQRIGNHAFTAGELNVNGYLLKTMEDRGLLTADRAGKPPIYHLSDMGKEAIALLNHVPEPHDSERPVERIQRMVAETFCVPLGEMVSERRTRKYVRARQAAMYLARETTPFSYPRIGHFFGGRDHTTVMHACQLIEGLLKTDPDIASKVERVRSALGGGLPPEQTDEERERDAVEGSAKLRDALLSLAA